MRLYFLDSTSESTAAHDNSYSTGYNCRAGNHIPLEIPAILFCRAAMAGHLRCIVQAAISEAIYVSRSPRRHQRTHPRQTTGRYTFQVRRYVQRKETGHSRESIRNHATTWMGLGRIASDGYGTHLPLVILLGATAADITVFRLVIL